MAKSFYDPLTGRISLIPSIKQADIKDIEIINAENGQFLQYENGIWKNKTKIEYDQDLGSYLIQQS